MTKQIKADLAILSITVVWGSSFVLMKNITGSIPFYAFLSLRFLVAAAILCMIFHKALRGIKLQAIFHGCVLGLMVFGGMALQYIGLEYTSASNSAFITGLNVVMVPVFSAVFLKKSPPLNAIIGVGLATAGLFFLSGGFSGSWNKGDSLTLLCAVCFAFQIIFIDKFAAKTDVRQLAVIQILSAAVFYSFLWLGFGWFQPIAFALDTRSVLTILYTGAMGTALAFGVQTIAQKFTTPTRTALIIACEPVFGAIFAVTLPDRWGVTETLSFGAVVGCLLILSGMLVTEVKFKRK
jgi:drug/metabolite transporter (DMT)-like permease